MRILTWDLAAHMQWVGVPEGRHPASGRPSVLPALPRYGEPLYWVCLAPLLRMLLHPGDVSATATMAHLVEIGDPVLGLLDAASTESGLAAPCARLRELIAVAQDPPPLPRTGATPRETMLRRFVVEELLRHQAYDPVEPFGERLFLFADEVEPLLRSDTVHPSSFVRRGAVAALGRYRTRAAAEALLAVAVGSEDPVVVVRAAAALGQTRLPLDWAPLVTRLARTAEPVQRLALVDALGRVGCEPAVPTLLALGAAAVEDPDPDLLQAVLGALARVRHAAHADEVEAFARRVEKVVGAQPGAFRPRTDEPAQPADRPDGVDRRPEILLQLALLVRLRLDPGEGRLARRALEPLSRARGKPLARANGDAAVAVQLYADTSLSEVPPAVRHLLLDALPRLGEPGRKALVRIASDDTLEPELRAYALARLPWEERTAIARRILADQDAPTALRIVAFERLAADHHTDVERMGRALLAECAAEEPGGGGAERRFLYVSAVRALGRRGLLSVGDLSPLLAHVEAPPEAFGGFPDEVRELVVDLVRAAAEGAQRVELERRIGEILELVIRHGMNTGLGKGQRAAARRFVRGQLEGVEAHDSEPGYRLLVVEAVLEHVLGYSKPVPSSDRAEFAPEVLLEEEILLALGRTGEPAAAEVLVRFLANRRNRNRAVAILALGRVGEGSTAGEVATFLLDADPFVRFCAYECLRLLTDKDVFVDWMYGPSAERFDASEEYWRWLQARR